MKFGHCITSLYALFLLLTPFGLAGAQSQTDGASAIAVQVRMLDPEVIVDVSFQVPVAPRAAWAVMIDYDHATEFISKLEKSVILSRSDKMLLVSQKGTMGWGPFSVPIETVTEVQLFPYEKLHGRMVSGSMKKNESTTRLSAVEGGTRVDYHLESIPDVWLPPLIGRAIVEYETRARFTQLVEEILRRKDLAEGRKSDR